MTWVVTHLQAVEPDELVEHLGCVAVPEPQQDSQGFMRVAVFGPTRDDVINYVRAFWGAEDAGWFEGYVIDRVERLDLLDASGAGAMD